MVSWSTWVLIVFGWALVFYIGGSGVLWEFVCFVMLHKPLCLDSYRFGLLGRLK